jgi:RNA polymerase sigma factor (TIGR02999 family)
MRPNTKSLVGARGGIYSSANAPQTIDRGKWRMAELVSGMSDANPDPSAEVSQALFALVYQELRRMARKQRRVAGSPVTLDTTALVHEVYLKLHASAQAQSVDRVHFLSLAARAMRQILVDHARSRSRIKRGGGCAITALGEDVGGASEIVDLVALDAALTQLAQIDPRAGQLVEWRIFSGMEIADIAKLQNLTERTVFRDWRRARAFLVQQLELDGSAA